MIRLHFFLFFLSCSVLFAQDIQYSQYYQAPLYLNPGLTGTDIVSRLGANFRLQWANVPAKFTTFSAWGDHHFEKQKSSVGFLITSDKLGTYGLSSTDVGLLYAYQLNINSNWVFKPGFQASIVNKSIDFDKLTFGDQYTNNGLSGNATTETFNVRSKLYPDLTLGGLLYNPVTWLGIAVNHLNTANQSFKNGNDRLPIKTSFHGGYKFIIKEHYLNYKTQSDEWSITPTFLYKNQGSFNQLDVGTYFATNQFQLGLWYRGIPVISTTNRDAVIVQSSIKINDLVIGYSYDITISKQTFRTGGAHELSLIYAISSKKHTRKPSHYRNLPCPSFFNKVLAH